MKNRIKRILALFLATIMVVSMANIVVSADEMEDYFASLLEEETVDEQEEEQEVVFDDDKSVLNYAIEKNNVITIENANVCLQMDKESGVLYVTDKKTGKLWASNSYNAKEDEIASGITKTNLLSQIIVSYIKNKNISTTNNYVASTSKGDAEYKVSGNILRVDYNFSSEGIKVPVEYVLKDTGFEVSVLFEEITDTESVRVHQVEVLPFFGAAGTEEEGYMFVPDGSGALINFNSPKLENFPYQKAYYGGDKGKIPNVSTTIDKELLLPVYGMRNGEEAFIATITSGAETASLYACVAGVKCNYNRIYTQATYRGYDVVNLNDAIGKKVYAKFAALDAVKLPKYSVEYTLLSGEDADYVGMAEQVRKNLNTSGLKKSDDGKAQLFTDFYGAVLKERAFLGIRYTGTQKLTTFAQAKTILEELKKNNIQNITVGYYNFSSSEYAGKLASNVAPSSKLGGKKGYSNLLDYSNENGINVYPYADFVSFSKNGNSYWSFSDVVLGLELSVIKRYDFAISDGNVDKTKPFKYLVSADKYNDAKKQILKSLNKYKSTGVMFRESANYIYNDYSSGGYQVDRTVKSMQEIYGEISNQGQKLLLSAPNGYAMTYADILTDIPMTSSQYVMFDEDVPFLQIVLKGTIKYSSESLNIDGLSDTTLLRLVETGSMPKFTMIYSEGRYLIGTDLANLYGATYTACVPKAVTYYKKVKELTDKISGSYIVEHKRESDLVTVTYSNSVKVYINYSSLERELPNGSNVEPLNYVIEG